MSGEFGQYDYRGYIDTVIKTIADECRTPQTGDPRAPLTRLFGSFLKQVADVAETIALLEAGDLGDESAAQYICTTAPALIKAWDRLNEEAERTLTE